MIFQVFQVLLVEDETIIAKLTENMLKKKSGGKFTVTIKSRLDAAVAALKEGDFDVVLLDLNLPDSQGLDTLKNIAEAAPEVAVVVLTATADNNDMGVRAMQLGAQDFLIKGEFNETSLQRAMLYSIERHRLQRTIRQLAVIDELTGLYNRRGFNSLNQDVLQRAAKSEGRGYICYFDLDRFKQINDELGHQKGDEALVEFSVNLRDVFRKDALIARLGGDEFVVMGIESRAGQVEDTLQALDVVLSVRNSRDSSGYKLETSAGVTYFGKDKPATIDELIAASDAELYENKQARRRARGLTTDVQLEESA
jgi:diguanylate cyclase (GGDEF)-like protein